MTAIIYWINKINLYCYITFLTSTLYIMAWGYVFKIQYYQSWVVFLLSLFFLLPKWYFRATGLIFLLLFQNNNFILFFALILNTLMIEFSYKENNSDLLISNGITSFLRKYIHYCFHVSGLRFFKTPNLISVVGASLSLIGLGLYWKFNFTHYAIACFLISFLFDFFDGYIANLYHIYSKYDIDGMCDRIVELAIVIFLFKWKGICLVSVLLLFGYLMNVLYTLNIQKYITIEIRPLIILIAIYPEINNIISVLLVYFAHICFYLFKKSLLGCKKYICN